MKRHRIFIRILAVAMVIGGGNALLNGEPWGFPFVLAGIILL